MQLFPVDHLVNRYDTGKTKNATCIYNFYKTVEGGKFLVYFLVENRICFRLCHSYACAFNTGFSTGGIEGILLNNIMSPNRSDFELATVISLHRDKEFYIGCYEVI